MPGEGEQARTWHNLQSEDGDVTMGDGDDDADDELVPGCYELDVDPSPVSDVDTIWIRAEYIRAYNYTESRYDRCYKRRRAAVVFTGHPGTGEWGCLLLRTTFEYDQGKTVSLLYILRRRLLTHRAIKFEQETAFEKLEKKPVIWYGTMDVRVIFC